MRYWRFTAVLVLVVVGAAAAAGVVAPVASAETPRWSDVDAR